ncbi:MAG TPA: glycosyltransferase family 9 protein [Eoetvoesiella sp.]
MPTLSAIYVRLPNWIGDVCMSLPSLDTLLNTKIPIVVCARPWARDLLAGYDLAGFIEMKGHWREDRSLVSAYKKKARHGHVRGVLLPDSLSSAMVFKFSGVPSAGYRDDGRSLILRWPVRKPAATLHAVESWHYITAQALKRWSLPVHPAKPGVQLGLKIAQMHQEASLAALMSAQLAPGRFILIAPTATGLHRGRNKVWPYFNQLTRSLQAQGHTVAMCPPPSEIADAQKNAPTALLLPTLNLGAFATLTRLAALVICNDSGVSHVAAAANARQLTLFGVTQRERTGPWSNNAICLGSETEWPTLAEVEQQALALTSQTVT